MKPIRVNVDFEEVISGKPSKPALLSSVEFFAFWVTNRTLLAHRNYPTHYLDYIEKTTGSRPTFVTSGEAENWWADLSNVPLMKELSSKTRFLNWLKTVWPMEAVVCSTYDEIECAIKEGPWLIKKSDGMSGRGHIRVTRSELPSIKDKLIKALANPVVVEPLYERLEDISALWLPEEKQFIYYSNLIDQRFQWRGTIINSTALFVPPQDTGEWSETLAKLQLQVESEGYKGPFSVDAFYYKHEGERKFHPGSEMNPRKTMGWLSWELWKKNKPTFASLQLIPNCLNESQWKEVINQGDVLVLSPQENQFVWYWIEASSSEELEKKQESFVTKLPAAPVRGKA